MKLKAYRYTEQERLTEFDLWITPSLGDIKDTIEFQNVLSDLQDGFRALSLYTDDFANPETCSAYHIAKSVISKIGEMGEIEQHMTHLFNAILLATGKSDNNLKCQYPIVLHRLSGTNEIAAVKNGRLIKVRIPRDFSMGKVVKYFSALTNYPELLAPLLKSYLDLLLSDEGYVMQLYSLGVSYHHFATQGKASNLLSSIAIFQARGSITARAGHEPEKILRSYMTDWGMVADRDFNTDDIDVYELLGQTKGRNVKARKYDFIVPYRSRHLGKKLFVQSQFYAGDSGSVSHKVVDQTDASRRQTLRKYPQAVFIEYLDGAGYFSSLNSDLKKMLAKRTTKDFIQIRTAPLKFRRELQEIDFLTPLEIEHALLKGYNREDEIIGYLNSQGYDRKEISRSLEVCRVKGIVSVENAFYSIKQERRDIAVKYSLLDCIANFGHIVNRTKEKGVLCVPGYAAEWGMNQKDLLESFSKEFPLVALTVKELIEKIQWLIDNEFVILR